MYSKMVYATLDRDGQIYQRNQRNYMSVEKYTHVMLL